MKTWILYVTFSRDVEWLRFSIESIVKYASGFAGICVVVPTNDIGQFRQFERYSTKDCPVVIKDFLEYPKKGFVHHLAMKCYADVLCPGATHIAHMDPDSLFCATVTPDDYFVRGKPVLLIEPYAELKKRTAGSEQWNRANWKEVTEKALRFECRYETMCRHPAVHHARTYRMLRDFMESVHQTPFADFVLKQENKYPQGFGEFNTLGAFALEKMANDYHFIDRGPDGEKNDPVNKVVQMWSHGGVHKYIPQIKKILS